MMHPFWIVVITLTVYWTIGLIVGVITRENEKFAVFWSAGLVYVLLYALFYPIRAMRTYTIQEIYFQHNGISRLQYFFGKRVRYKRVDD